MNNYKINDFLFNNLDDIEPTETEPEVDNEDITPPIQSVKEVLTLHTNVSLQQGEFDKDNDRAKGFNIVKKNKTGDSSYILMTFSGKIFEKVNSDDWKQTFPNK